MSVRISQILVFCLVLMLHSFHLSAQIPSIQIIAEEEIVDEPKVPAVFTYIDTDGQVWTRDIGIEIRGGFSQTFPKKTYDIEFWSDPTGSESVDVTFGNLREDDDWILDALYNEPLRINSFITHKLWLDINELYYKDLEPEAKSGADVMYVEVSINGEYNGIYMLSEEIDRKQLKLRRNDDESIKGELYKAYAWDDAVLYNNPDAIPNNASSTWSGFEYRYPNDVIDWSNIEELVKFVANSSDEEFIAQVGQRFDLENLMDYYILLNLPRILDNRGKNIYLCRYDVGEPYFFAPWDLDGSWGLLWNGNNDSVTEGALTNNLYDRLIATNAQEFRQRISEKWNEYRQTLISDSALDERINMAHDFLMDNGIYEKEASTWDYEYSEGDLDYLFEWLEDRLEFLDNYFNKITAIKVIRTEEAFNIFPNPADSYINISNNEESDFDAVIYDMNGEEVKRLKVNDSDAISIEDLVPGIYVLYIAGSSEVFIKVKG